MTKCVCCTTFIVGHKNFCNRLTFHFSVHLFIICVHYIYLIIIHSNQIKWLIRTGRLNPEFAPLRDAMARELNLKLHNMAVAYDIATQMAQVIISLH